MIEYITQAPGVALGLGGLFMIGVLVGLICGLYVDKHDGLIGDDWEDE